MGLDALVLDGCIGGMLTIAAIILAMLLQAVFQMFQKRG